MAFGVSAVGMGVVGLGWLTFAVPSIAINPEQDYAALGVLTMGCPLLALGYLALVVGTVLGFRSLGARLLVFWALAHLPALLMFSGIVKGGWF